MEKKKRGERKERGKLVFFLSFFLQGSLFIKEKKGAPDSKTDFQIFSILPPFAKHSSSFPSAFQAWLGSLLCWTFLVFPIPSSLSFLLSSTMCKKEVVYSMFPQLQYVINVRCCLCDKLTPISLVEEHEKICGGVVVECVGKEAGCLFSNKRKDLPTHESECHYVRLLLATAITCDYFSQHSTLRAGKEAESLLQQ